MCLLNPRSHGFYRFLAWETLLVMFIFNASGWFHDPLAWYQLTSWILLIISIIMVAEGIRLLRQLGQQDSRRSDPTLYGIEKTSYLVTNGLYRYIRHPMYSSLFFLGWGIFFKSPSLLDAMLALVCSAFLVITAMTEERENVSYFGQEYVNYIKNSKRFIPYIF